MSVWYEDRSILVDFAQILVDAEFVEDKKEVIAKPYKYDDAFDKWQSMGYPDQDDDDWDAFIEALSLEDDDDENEEDE